MKNQKGVTLFELLWVALIGFGVVGWVLNIIDIVHAISEPITGMFILRCIGIIVGPLGAVLGYF